MIPTMTNVWKCHIPSSYEREEEVNFSCCYMVETSGKRLSDFAISRQHFCYRVCAFCWHRLLLVCCCVAPFSMNFHGDRWSDRSSFSCVDCTYTVHTYTVTVRCGTVSHCTSSFKHTHDVVNLRVCNCLFPLQPTPAWRFHAPFHTLWHTHTHITRWNLEA